jgi:hypothetical protein
MARRLLDREPNHPDTDDPGTAVTQLLHRDVVGLRRRALPATWPLWLLLPGMGLWWALGVVPLARPVIGLAVWTHLLARRDLRFPPGFTLWVLFLGWAFLSVLQLSPGRFLSVGLRFSEYAVITALLLYTYNLPRAISDLAILRVLLAFWVVLVLGGWASVLAPELTLPSLGHALLPGALLRHEFAEQITTPYVAQIHLFMGYPLPRPAAPFTYATGWGSAVGLLFPFVLCGLLVARRRRALLLVSASMLVPTIMSVNRGMFASVIAGAVALTVTTPEAQLRRQLRRGLTFGVPVFLAVVLLSPLANVVEDRIENPHSNNARSDLAEQAVQLVADSPWLGHGAPKPYSGYASRPPVGTQGQLWSLLIFHGIPGTALFLGFFGVAFRHSRGPRWGPWTRAAIVAMAVQLPVYGMMGGQAAILAVAVAAALREADQTAQAAP